MYAIAFLAATNKARIAERAFTRYTYSDYTYGGFCVATPGAVSSADILGSSDDVRAQTWKDREHWCKFENKIYDENVLVESLRTNKSLAISSAQLEEEIQGKGAAAEKHR